MPLDSSWKTLVVSPDWSSAKVAASSIGMRLMSKGSSTRSGRLSMSPTAMSMTVRVLRPRKSNFTSPADSTSFLSYWVT